MPNLNFWLLEQWEKLATTGPQYHKVMLYLLESSYFLCTGQKPLQFASVPCLLYPSLPTSILICLASAGNWLGAYCSGSYGLWIITRFFLSLFCFLTCLVPIPLGENLLDQAPYFLSFLIVYENHSHIWECTSHQLIQCGLRSHDHTCVSSSFIWMKGRLWGERTVRKQGQ